MFYLTFRPPVQNSIPKFNRKTDYPGEAEFLNGFNIYIYKNGGHLGPGAVTI